MVTFLAQEEITEPIYLIDANTEEYIFCVLLRLRKLHGNEWIEIPIIYDQDTGKYLYVDVTMDRLIKRLNERDFIIEFIPEQSYQTCDNCNKFMQQGFVFEGDNTCYCEECLPKVISEEEYNQLYEEGLAYWTEWFSC